MVGLVCPSKANISRLLLVVWLLEVRLLEVCLWLDSLLWLLWLILLLLLLLGVIEQLPDTREELAIGRRGKGQGGKGGNQSLGGSHFMIGLFPLG